MPTVVKVAQHRITYLLRRFAMSRQELLDELNRGRKRKLAHTDVFGNHIKFSTVKLIDKVFQFGLAFYFGPRLDSPADPGIPGMFFRKSNRTNPLSLVDKRVVSEMARRAAQLSFFAENSSWRIPEALNKRKICDCPVAVAEDVRREMLPQAKSSDKRFLVHLIDILSECGVLVMEYVDMSLNKENMSEIDGLYFKPNYIVLKRNNLSYKSEIFTLMHEVGHYLLNKEEIDVAALPTTKEELNGSSDEERWCDEFAFAFLLGDLGDSEDLSSMSPGQVEKLSDDKHLSKLAIYMHLFKNGKMSADEYLRLQLSITSTLMAAYEAKLNRSQVKEKPGSRANPLYQQPIVSKLEKHICATACRDGYLDEGDLIARFRPKRLDDIYNAW